MVLGAVICKTIDKSASRCCRGNSMDENSIDLTITSPPYDQLRNYEGYDFDFKSVADGLYKVTHY